MSDLKILKIEILIGTPGTDKVFITTNLPSPFPKSVSNDTLTLSYEVQKDKGVEYVKTHFGGYPTIIIDTKTGEKSVLC